MKKGLIGPTNTNFAFLFKLFWSKTRRLGGFFYHAVSRYFLQSELIYLTFPPVSIFQISPQMKNPPLTPQHVGFPGWCRQRAGCSHPACSPQGKPDPPQESFSRRSLQTQPEMSASTSNSPILPAKSLRHQKKKTVKLGSSWRGGALTYR